MCRSTDLHGFNFNVVSFVDRNRLKLNGFYVRLSLSSRACKSLPESLTLVYLPRINASPLEVDGLKIRPDSPAFVTLHRVVMAGEKKVIAGGVVFASRERVRASEGVRFEVYWGEEKVLKGIFRRDAVTEEWKMECKCAMERKVVGVEVAEAEVCAAVEGEGGVAMSEKVEMVVKRKKKKGFRGLEEIPEEREVVEDEEIDDSCDCGGGGGGCCLGEEEKRDGSGMDGGDCEDEEVEVEMEMEGVRWAVDVGILVMSLGLGFLVSKASSKSLRRRRIL